MDEADSTSGFGRMGIYTTVDVPEPSPSGQDRVSVILQAFANPEFHDDGGWTITIPA